jgi:hypothetical protein
MKLIGTRFSPDSCYFNPFKSKHSLSTLFSTILSLCSSLKVKDQDSESQKTTRRTAVVYAAVMTIILNRMLESITRIHSALRVFWNCS